MHCLIKKNSLLALFDVLDALAAHPSKNDADSLQRLIVDHIEKHKVAYPHRADSLQPNFIWPYTLQQTFLDLESFLDAGELKDATNH